MVQEAGIDAIDDTGVNGTLGNTERMTLGGALVSWLSLSILGWAGLLGILYLFV